VQVTAYPHQLAVGSVLRGLLWPKERALPGRWIDGESTYGAGRAGTQWKSAGEAG